MKKQYNYKLFFSGTKLSARKKTNPIYFILLISFLVTNYSIFAQNNFKTKKNTPLTIGQTIELHSGILNKKRILNVYLPYDAQIIPLRSMSVQLSPGQS